jgi:DUF4097 and DUF4098 domain-containing protein YvlB
MYRTFVLAVTVLALAAPTPGSAQSGRDRERDRIQREQEREQERREREQERREREQERRDRDREREQERRQRERERRDRGAGTLMISNDTAVSFDPRGTVTVNCPGGAVIITGAEGNQLRVRARSEHGAVRFSSNGTRATLEPASAGRDCREGQFEVTVPSGAHVSASSWSGLVRVRGVHGEVEARTQSADIDIRDVGRLDLETLSGDVSVQGVKGDAVIRTVSGDVRLDGAQGDVEIETVSGSMTLRDIVAKQIRTHSTSGDVEFAGVIADAGRYEFTTHSGEVRLQLPADVGAQLSVSTFSGAIESDFPITLAAGDHAIGAAQAKRLNFTVGRGSARLVVETFSGDVTLSSVGRRR